MFETIVSSVEGAVHAGHPRRHDGAERVASGDELSHSATRMLDEVDYAASTKRRQRSMTSSSCACISLTDSITSTIAIAIALRTRGSSGVPAACNGSGGMLCRCAVRGHQHR